MLAIAHKSNYCETCCHSDGTRRLVLARLVRVTALPRYWATYILTFAA